MRADHILSLDCTAAGVADAMRGTTTNAVAEAVTIDPPVAQPAPVTPEQAKLEFVTHKRKRSPAALLESHPGAKASSSAPKPPEKDGRKLSDLAALQCSRICIRGISSSGPSKLVHIQPRRQPGTKNDKLADLAALQCSRICIRGISSSGPSKLVHIQPRRQPGTENENNKCRIEISKLCPPQREEEKLELQQKRKWEVMERGGLAVAPMQQPISTCH